MIKIFTILFFSFFTLFVSGQPLQPLDNGSSVKFVIKNFGINTAGSFEGLTGNINYDPNNPLNSVFDVNIKAETIDTDIAARDNHLRKEEFFNAASFPEINFKSTRVSLTNSNDHLYMFGVLTIKGISKEIKFPFSVKPSNNGYLFEGSFTLNRHDFNLGGKSLSLGDEVNVELSVFAR